MRRIHLEINNKPVTSRRVPCELRRRIALRLRPCPVETVKPYELDTAGRVFRQGLNRIRVCVDDFATVGERNRVCVRHQARVDNECPVDEGSEPGRIAARVSRTWPGRPLRHVTGTLTDGAGEPIEGARICVATRTDVGGAVERVVATPRTGPGGRFEARLERGASREVRVAHWRDAQHVAERFLRFRVRAHPQPRVSPTRTLRNGERASLRRAPERPEQRQAQRRARGAKRRPLGTGRLRPREPRGVWRDSATAVHLDNRHAHVPLPRARPAPARIPRDLRGTSEVRRVRVRG